MSQALLEIHFSTLLLQLLLLLLVLGGFVAVCDGVVDVVLVLKFGIKPSLVFVVGLV